MADTPSGNVLSASCPSRAALEVVGSKWALLIVPLLAQQPLRNNELLRQVGGISQKMLTQTLRELERHGLVQRIDHQSVPPHVEYRLTGLGQSLSEALVVIDRWAESNFAAVASARMAFDRRR
ncbi:winged helix-turn-helix transcriptional regulator [Roseateles sp. NT4]|uniref:winged helix-turn-helix transcriptional regulator n=1 Tax=Roseateles sp. NT4 TaxID=3453715 RepID=UPI003EEF7F3F